MSDMPCSDGPCTGIDCPVHEDCSGVQYGGVRDWYFTFGFAHAHPNGYVIIHGTHDAAREQMQRWYADRWAFQYESAEAAGVEQFGLREVRR